jgi:hypothetical protein
MKQSRNLAWLACLLPLLNPGPLPADEQKDENAVNCIQTSRIRNTKIVDDSSILFYVSGKTVYHNILPRRCRGLLREKRFSYHVSGGRLCHLDSIRILYHGGGGLQEGISCSLGYFRKVTEEEIDLLLNREPTPPQPKPLPSAEPEEIITDPES